MEGTVAFGAAARKPALPRVKVTVPKGPLKRSVMIAGHATSVSLEPIFWEALRAAAAEEGVPLSALVARLDAQRVESTNPPNLASFLRMWLFSKAKSAQK